MDKIYHYYDKYDDIVKSFGEAKIQGRFNDLYTEIECFVKKLHMENKVQINSVALMHAVMDYFTDIHRLKTFHNIEKTNLFKTKAYEINWILRRRPIQVISENKNDDYNDELTFINEKFALSHITLFYVSLVGLDFYDGLSSENQRAFDGYIDSIYYYLKYRDCSSQTLEMILLSFGAGIVAVNRSLGSLYDY